MEKTDRNITILVVDDSDIIRQSLKTFFRDYNIEVITCHDGLEGIQKSIDYKPSLIFLDLMMPNFDGVKMLQVIKVLDDLKTIPVLVISGNTNKRNVIASIEAGADRVISKPLQKDIILKNVGEILGEDFLASHKKGNIISEQDNKEIIHKLREFFINSFQLKRDGIRHALQSKNNVLLKAIIHEIKGTGGAIGYPELTRISTDIETLLRSTNVDWDLIKNKCDKILSIATEIESSFICL